MTGRSPASPPTNVTNEDFIIPFGWRELDGTVHHQSLEQIAEFERRFRRAWIECFRTLPYPGSRA